MQGFISSTVLWGDAGISCTKGAQALGPGRSESMDTRPSEDCKLSIRGLWSGFFGAFSSGYGRFAQSFGGRFQRLADSRCSPRRIPLESIEAKMLPKHETEH